jgi:hypothetical protein
MLVSIKVYTLQIQYQDNIYFFTLPKLIKILMICLIFAQHLWCKHYRFRTAYLSLQPQPQLWT